MTSDVDINRELVAGNQLPRTAATAARQHEAAQRAAVRLTVEPLSKLPDGHLVALVAALLGQVLRRGLALRVP